MAVDAMLATARKVYITRAMLVRRWQSEVSSDKEDQSVAGRPNVRSPESRVAGQNQMDLQM